MSNPSFQRRHYEAIAATIRDTMIPLLHREFIARNFAATFAADNPRFDRARFLKACGIDAS